MLMTCSAQQHHEGQNGREESVFLKEVVEEESQPIFHIFSRGLNSLALLYLPTNYFLNEMEPCNQA
jgi:hypothetical protein